MAYRLAYYAVVGTEAYLSDCQRIAGGGFNDWNDTAASCCRDRLIYEQTQNEQGHHIPADLIWMPLFSCLS